MKWWPLMLVLTAGLLVAADDPKDEAVKKETALLQGTWTPVSFEIDGMKLPDERLKEYTLTIKGDKMSHKAGDGVEEVSFKLDLVKKPKAIDFTSTRGKQEGKSMPGIYSLEGDTLKLCIAQPGVERPTAFASKPGSKIGLIILQREKP